MRGLKYLLYRPEAANDMMLIVLGLGLFGVGLIYGINYLQVRNKKAKLEEEEFRKKLRR